MSAGGAREKREGKKVSSVSRDIDCFTLMHCIISDLWRCLPCIAVYPLKKGLCMAAANAVTVIVHSDDDDDGSGGEFANSNVEQIVSLSISIMRCNILSHNWHRRNVKEISLSSILHSLSLALLLSASEVPDVVAKCVWLVAQSMPN